MARDPLDVLVRLRQQSQDQAQTGLANAISAAAAADQAAHKAQIAIRTEQDAASALTADDNAVEVFARWLPAARVRLETATRYAERAQAEVTRSRALLSACRTALESVTALAAGRAAARTKTRVQQEERALSEYRAKL